MNIKIEELRNLCVDIELVKGGMVEGMNIEGMMNEMNDRCKELDMMLDWEEWGKWASEWREMKAEWDKGNYKFMIERV